MDKIQKFLKSLNKKEFSMMLLLIEQILTDYTKVPHVLPLKGKKGWYRVKVGRFRIIFSTDSSGIPDIKRITRRNEDTYKDL